MLYTIYIIIQNSIGKTLDLETQANKRQLVLFEHRSDIM